MAKVVFWSLERVADWLRFRSDIDGVGKTPDPLLGEHFPAHLEFEAIDLDAPRTRIQVAVVRDMEKEFLDRVQSKLAELGVESKMKAVFEAVSGETMVKPHYPRHLVKRLFPAARGRRRHRALQLGDDEALVPHVKPVLYRERLPEHLARHFEGVVRSGGILPSIREVERLADILSRVDEADLFGAHLGDLRGLARLSSWYMGRGVTSARPGRSKGFPELVKASLVHIEVEGLGTKIPLPLLRALLFPGKGTPVKK